MSSAAICLSFFSIAIFFSIIFSTIDLSGYLMVHLTTSFPLFSCNSHLSNHHCHYFPLFSFFPPIHKNLVILFHESLLDSICLHFAPLSGVLPTVFAAGFPLFGKLVELCFFKVSQSSDYRHLLSQQLTPRISIGDYRVFLFLCPLTRFPQNGFWSFPYR